MTTLAEMHRVGPTVTEARTIVSTLALVPMPDHPGCIMKRSTSPARQRASKAQVADGSCPLTWVTWVAHTGEELPASSMEVMRHTCDVQLCVNPEHLIPGSQIENALDRKVRGRNGVGWARQGYLCRRGHDMLVAENITHTGAGQRLCLPCQRIRSRGETATSGWRGGDDA